MSDEQVPPPETPSAPPPPPPEPPPPAAPPPLSGGGSVSENRSVMIVLAYFGPLALIPLLVEKDDSEVQWHSKHGLVLFVAEIILWIVLTIINLAASAVFPPLGCIITMFYLLLALGILVFHVMCMIKGVNGERLTVPTVSEFADKF